MNWITVKECLPEIGRLVIVEGGVATYEMGEWYSQTRQEDVIISWTVTHWMPLPKLTTCKCEESNK